MELWCNFDQNSIMEKYVKIITAPWHFTSKKGYKKLIKGKFTKKYYKLKYRLTLRC